MPNPLTFSRLGKTAVPVKPLQSVYARFKHLVGVPAYGTSGHVPFSKLRNLDNLIDRFMQMQSGEDRGVREKGRLLTQLQKEIHDLVSLVRPVFGGAFAEATVLVDILA
jgi:hypothetical protein